MKGFRSIKTILALAIISIILFCLDLWKNYSDVAESTFKNWIAPVFDTAKISLVYYLIVTAFLIVYHKDRVKKLEEEATDELQLQIKANRKLSEYQRRDILHSYLQKFVSYQSAVHAVQMYRYTIKKQQDVVIFKVEHVNGFVDEGIELNALEQIYFRVDREVYRAFISAKAMWDKAENPRKLIEFIHEYGRRIEPLAPDDLMEEDAILYSMIQLAVDMIEPSVEQDLPLSLSEDLFNALNMRKRTGLLRAILLEDDFYRFRYVGNGEKQGRMYLCQRLMMWGINHACLITLDSEIIYDDDAFDQLNKIESDFIEGLHNEFNTVYNREYQRVEGDRNET